MKNLIVNSANIVDAYDISEKFRKHKPEIMYKQHVVKTRYGRQLTKTYLTVINMEGKDGRVQSPVRQSMPGMEYGPGGNVIISEVDAGSFECKV